MSKFNCSNLLELIDFKSNIIRKAKYILSNNINWKMYSDLNSRISRKVIKIFKKLNIDKVYDEKKRIFLISDLEKEIIAFLFSAIVVIACYIDDISNSPYLLFKDIDYHKIFDKKKSYDINNSEVKSYIDLFNSYYEYSEIEKKLLKSFKEDNTYLLNLRELKLLINKLMNEITLKEFDDEASIFIDDLHNCRLTPIIIDDQYNCRLTPKNEDRLVRNSSFETYQCDMEIKTLRLPINYLPSEESNDKKLVRKMSFDALQQIVNMFIPISPLNSEKYNKSQQFFNTATLV
jgi:hypothetical protein